MYPHEALRNARGHLRTITRHKLLVGELCFKVGLYRQGLAHDLSKYTPSEFATGIRYFQGNRSPNAVERIETGRSGAWLHHKGRNKHHFEYWLDVKGPGDVSYSGVPMPTRYIVEMFCDRVAACKVYQGEGYTQHSALEYWRKNSGYNRLMHPDSAALLELMLLWLDELGEDAACERIRTQIVKPRYCGGEQARW